MKQEYDIVEGNTLQEAFDKGYKKYRCLPLSLKEVWKLREEKKIPDVWYDSSTLFFKGEFRTGTIKEFKDLKKFYDEGGRVPFAGNYYKYGLNGNYGLLDYCGRFVCKKRTSKGVGDDD